ncbi:MAG: hypothetical protein COU66_03025 [Candidatus Pacebacteria bacterium CG10_big_fil_rev_8_21_14_0_10_44_11]|nr:MAG: hypothetical protein COU66_03025 [Candidatus Pacebacteria bacterium CG10_big_fil_rev_8_21_14_0_10_44_11]
MSANSTEKKQKCMKSLENNIAIFNIDVTKKGQYLYTDAQNVSAQIATTRQSTEIIRLIKDYIGTGKTILDIGAGDGTFTIELFKTVSPKLIVGFDPASQAIRAARKKIKSSFKGRIVFKILNIYDLTRYFKKGEFDVAVVRGVLHHLDDVQAAITQIGKVVDQVIVLEPNGYNPILKIIEKVSSYHQRHDEKSYWPPHLLQWFGRQGYSLVEQRFVCIVPYFCPSALARVLKCIEPFFERLPLIRRYYTGTNVFLVKK